MSCNAFRRNQPTRTRCSECNVLPSCLSPSTVAFPTGSRAASEPLRLAVLRFIAALYFTGFQLLVVTARHPSVDGVTHRIQMGQYREVYLNLQGTPTREGKLFIQDSGADGILAALPEAARWTFSTRMAFGRRCSMEMSRARS
jgi:hypothetical protein